MTNHEKACNNNDSQQHPLSQAASQLHLYNTATHQTSQFVPSIPGHVGMYVCGATVQSSPHIGHIRAAIAFDIIRRWLIRLGYDVTFVRNVTDIDDKIMMKASQAGQHWWQRAYFYEREFTDAYETLGVLAPTVEPRATGHIPQMVELITRLIERNHAYVITDEAGKPTGNVYFDVPSWQDYGELTHQGNEHAQQLDEAATVAEQKGPSVDASGEDKYNPTDPADLSADKHHPRDFALWKAPCAFDQSDAAWQTPFGLGRPGWHIECSAMSHTYLGDAFDIHGGGLDLRFPHHENEIAQTRAAGWKSANVWMHSAWVTAKGEKMSKSLGNGLSVPSVLAAHHPWTVRYALGAVQYRAMLEWSDQTLKEAQLAFDRIMNFIKRAERVLGEQPSRNLITSLNADELPEEFRNAMNDDINVAGAHAAIFNVIRQTNTILDQIAQHHVTSFDNHSTEPTLLDTLRSNLIAVRAMLDTLGLDPYAPCWQSETQVGHGCEDASSTVLSRLIEQQLEARSKARAAKDFATADAIRDTLQNVGITIEDTAQGSTWHLS